MENLKGVASLQSVEIKEKEEAEMQEIFFKAKSMMNNVPEEFVKIPRFRKIVAKKLEKHHQSFPASHCLNVKNEKKYTMCAQDINRFFACVEKKSGKRRNNGNNHHDDDNDNYINMNNRKNGEKLTRELQMALKRTKEITKLGELMIDANINYRKKTNTIFDNIKYYGKAEKNAGVAILSEGDDSEVERGNHHGYPSHSKIHFSSNNSTITHSNCGDHQNGYDDHNEEEYCCSDIDVYGKYEAYSESLSEYIDRIYYYKNFEKHDKYSEDDDDDVVHHSTAMYNDDDCILWNGSTRKNKSSLPLFYVNNKAIPCRILMYHWFVESLYKHEKLAKGKKCKFSITTWCCSGQLGEKIKEKSNHLCINPAHLILRVQYCGGIEQTPDFVKSPLYSSPSKIENILYQDGKCNNIDKRKTGWISIKNPFSWKSHAFGHQFDPFFNMANRLSQSEVYVPSTKISEGFKQNDSFGTLKIVKRGGHSKINLNGENHHYHNNIIVATNTMVSSDDIIREISKNDKKLFIRKRKRTDVVPHCHVKNSLALPQPPTFTKETTTTGKKKQSFERTQQETSDENHIFVAPRKNHAQNKPYGPLPSAWPFWSTTEQWKGSKWGDDFINRIDCLPGISPLYNIKKDGTTIFFDHGYKFKEKTQKEEEEYSLFAYSKELLQNGENSRRRAFETISFES